MATDAEIRARGINFLSPQRYLQNPYQFEEVVEEEVIPQGGITNTNAFTNSGGRGNNFSVYNPDPNSLPSYKPNYDYRQFSEYDSDPSTEDIKQMDMNQKYFNAPPPSKIEGLVRMLPGVGTFSKGVNFLGNQIGPYIPPNRRAIMENELAGKGVMVNDIGQIVAGNSGSAFDPSGVNIMAGYNAYHVDQDTFDKRRAKAKEKMSAPGFDKFNIALTAAEKNFLDAKDKSKDIYDFEEKEKDKKKKDTIIGRFITKKKEKREVELNKEIEEYNLKIAQDAQAIKDAASAEAAATGNYTAGGSHLSRGTSGGGLGLSQAQAQSVSQANKDAGYSSFSGLAKGGRVGYFFGGRVNYKKGGRINFRGGGMDASSDDFGSEDFGGDKDDNREQYGAVGQYSTGPTSTNTKDDSKTITPPVAPPPGRTIIDKIRYNPIINNPLTRLVARVGLYSVNPALGVLDYRTARQLKGVYDTATEDIDDDDVTLNKYKQGGRVNFKNGGLASIL